MLDTPNQSRISIFQHFTPQSHMIYLSLILVLWYETPLRKRMGVLDTQIFKSMAREDSLVTQSIQVGTKCIVQTKHFGDFN